MRVKRVMDAFGNEVLADVGECGGVAKKDIAVRAEGNVEV